MPPVAAIAILVFYARQTFVGISAGLADCHPGLFLLARRTVARRYPPESRTTPSLLPDSSRMFVSEMGFRRLAWKLARARAASRQGFCGVCQTNYWWPGVNRGNSLSSPLRGG
jgi:hypothetical protein